MSDAVDDDLAGSTVFRKPPARAWAVSFAAHAGAFALLGVAGTYLGVRVGVIPPSVIELDAPPPRRPPPVTPPPQRTPPATPDAPRQPAHAPRPSARSHHPARAGHVAAPHVLAAPGNGNGGDEMPVGDNNDFQGGTVGNGGGDPAPPAPTAPEPEAPVHAATGRRGPVQLPEEAVPPEPMDRPMPAYPESARRGGVQAEVVARVVVDEGGAVSDVEILRGHPDFDAVVREALRRWRYRPATVDGQALAVYQIVRVPFRLENL